MTFSPESEASAEGEAELERRMATGHDRTNGSAMHHREHDRTPSNSKTYNWELGRGERVAAMFGGAFLFSFGLPFTLVPVMVWGTFFGGDDTGMTQEPLWLMAVVLCFPIPFLLAGLAVQFSGIKVILAGLRGYTEVGMDDDDDDEEPNRSGDERSDNEIDPRNNPFRQSSFPSMAEVQQAQQHGTAATNHASTLQTATAEETTASTRVADGSDEGHAEVNISKPHSTEATENFSKNGLKNGSFWHLEPEDEA